MTSGLLELFDELKRQIRRVGFSHELYSQMKEEAVQVKDQKIVRDLIQCLQDRTEEPFTRAIAADLLGIIGDPIALDVLIEAVSYEDEEELEIRYYAADALGEMGDKAAVKPLIQILETPDKDSDDIRVFCHIANALRLIGDPSAAEALLAVLVDDYPIGWFDHHATYDYRAMAGTALIELGDENIAKQLLDLLAKSELNRQQYKDDSIRDDIARIIGGMRYTPAIPALLNLLHKVDYDYRCAIAYHLANFNDPRVIEALLATLNDSDEEIRSCAKQALDQLGYASQ